MTQYIPPSFIKEVLAKSDIVEVIQSRLPLTRRGNNYLALCPFHQEKTPSFTVNKTNQFYYCFGCSANGNVIGFLMDVDHLPFREAVTYLANQLGLQIPSTDAEPSPNQLFYPLLEKAAQFYQRNIRQYPNAIDYLKSRGLSGQIAKTFAIGYASPQWEQLHHQFAGDPQQISALVTNGLLIQKNSRIFDRFRHRIMFPIRNSQGQIIGFGGRALGEDLPKYLNSPETPIFHKGSELYGLYECRQQQKNSSWVELIIVEGYMDVISLHQHGISNAVATLGTAITKKQIQKLLHHSNRLVFCFDGDTAGRQAAWKALLISLPLLHEGIYIRFLYLPEKEDPDSFIRKIGPEAFAQRINQAPGISEVFFAELKKQIPYYSQEGKAHFAHQAAQYLNTMPQGIFRQLLYAQLAQELRMDSTGLELLLNANPQITKTYETSSIPTRQLPPPLHLAISILLQHPSLIESIEDIHLTSIHSLEIPHKNFFIDLLQAFQQQPILTVAELLSTRESKEERELIATLAARPLTIPLEGLQAEFLGAIAYLLQQADEQKISKLIMKAKNTPLSSEEKKSFAKFISQSQKRGNYTVKKFQFFINRKLL